MAGKRSKSSERWLRRQKKDYFVRAAQSQGQVSRAHFKLLELDRKYRLIKPNDQILELGAAPGGWTNYIEEKLSNKGRLLAVDPLPITAGANTLVIAGLVGDAEVDAQLEEQIDAAVGLDLVLSDMAPNMSGVRAVDQARSMELADFALDAARSWMKPGGHMVVKTFQGEGLEAWVDEVRGCFKTAALTKPKSSRAESREVFLVARGFSGKRDAIDGLV